MTAQSMTRLIEGLQPHSGHADVGRLLQEAEAALAEGEEAYAAMTLGFATGTLRRDGVISKEELARMIARAQGTQDETEAERTERLRTGPVGGPTTGEDRSEE